MKTVTIHISDDLYEQFQRLGKVFGDPLTNSSIELMLEMGCHLFSRIVLAMLPKEDA